MVLPRSPAILNSKELLAELETRETGLTKKESEERLLKFGLNEIEAKKEKKGWRILLEQFKSPLILLLIVASIISFFLGDTIDAAIIVVIVIINSFLGFFQEYKAEKVVRELRKLLPLEAVVKRDAVKMTIPAEQLVPGDFVYLKIGDIVPADIRLTEVDELTTNEAGLTGESVPVTKTAEPLAKDSSQPHELLNTAFMGTSVTSGYAGGVVIATGSNTFFGKTASSMKEADEPSDFEKSIGGLSRFLLKIVIGMTIFILLANALLHQNFLASFLFALALAVGITPESLPIVITISLSRGARKLSKSKVIVKKLTAIEDVGNMDILCTDKTGTLTEGALSLQRAVTLEDKNDSTILLYGLLCTNAIDGSMIDKALWLSPEKASLQERFKTYTILDKNEFDFERRRMSVVVKDPNGKRWLIVKGAVEAMEQVSSSVPVRGKAESFEGIRRAAYEKIRDGYRKQGYTTIGVGMKQWDSDNSDKTDEKDLIFIGFLVFIDPPRFSAKKSLMHLEKLGVAIKVLSGDDPFVTHTICQKVGLIIAKDKVITGDELDKLSDKEFSECIHTYNVFARIAPAHKHRIVQTINNEGHTIGFMGDGINDAPAIKAADVGISVNTATPIAKEAADIILLEKDLGVVVTAVTEGRTIFTNITKYLLNTVSANFGNMFTVAFSSLFLKFIPLLPSQILLNNLITDTPMVAISTDRVDHDSLLKPKKLDLSMINRFMRTFGILSTVFDLVLIAGLLLIFKTDQEAFRSAWFFESVVSELLITFSLRTEKSFYKSKPSSILFWLSVGMFGILIIMFLPTPLAGILHFTPLSGSIYLFIAAIVAVYFVASELVKRHFFQVKKAVVQ